MQVTESGSRCAEQPARKVSRSAQSRRSGRRDGSSSSGQSDRDGRRMRGERFDALQDSSSGYGSQMNDSERRYRGQKYASPPPHYSSLYPERVQLPSSESQYPSTDEFSDAARKERPQKKKRQVKRQGKRSQRPPSSSRRHNRNSSGYSTDSASQCGVQCSDSDTSETGRHEDRRRRRNRRISQRRRSVDEQVTIYDEQENFRDNKVRAPELLIHTCAPQSVSERRMKLGNACIDYKLLPVVTETDAKDFLVKHTKQKFGYGTKAAKKCEIRRIRPQCVFRYRLETLGEVRSIEKKTEAYNGQKIDGPKSGATLDVWQVPIECPSGYREETFRHRMPHSSKIITCPCCDGSGRQSCITCGGGGYRLCDHCHGGGYEEMYRYSQHGNGTDSTYRIPCHHCPGNGKLSCCNCGGSGDIRCSRCNGCKKVVQYDELIVNWKTVTNYHVDECRDVSEKHLLRAVGEQVLFRESEDLEPITRNDLLHDEIRRKSKTFLESHNMRKFRKLKQRHIVDLVPVNEVQYSYHEKVYNFFLLGLDRRVHAPNYPHRHCWGCCVM